VEQPRAKARWTAEDRRKAAESEQHGFGYRKEAPGAGGKSAKHGQAAKPGKAGKAGQGKAGKAKAGKVGQPGKGKPVRDKDKGKRRKPS